MAQHILHVDIETYCDLDLSEVGVHVYAAHPSFKIILIGYAIDDGPIVCMQWDEFMFANDHKLRTILWDNKYLKVAHNAMFEMVCINQFIHIEVNQWNCTMVMCKQLGLPGSLDMAARVLNAPGKIEAKRLIKLFSMPGKDGKRQAFSNNDFDQFVEYNKRDVEIERFIYNKLCKFDMAEKELFRTDYNINERGVEIDKRLAENALALAGTAYASAYERLMAKTGLAKPTDDAIKKLYGIPSLSAKKLPALRKAHPEFEEVLDLRGQLAKTSIKKYEAMLKCIGKDKRARGLTQFYGAGRTGRWSGRLIQLQNLPKIKLTPLQLESARKAVLFGDDFLFNALYGDDRLATLSQLIRTALVPSTGHKFVIADFSAIEARVLAWLANEQWRLDVFKGDGRIYEASAERMFGRPPGSIGKDDPLRQKGKIAELALGYGGSVGALINMGAIDMGLKEEELPRIVKLWRQANTSITRLWRDLGDVLYAVLNNKSTISKLPHLAVFKKDNVLQIELPSGRKLSYQTAFWDGRETKYWGVNQVTNIWEEQQLYGAKATENIVQAIARDCLAELLQYAEDRAWRPVFHVHDEIILEVPDAYADDALKGTLWMMGNSPKWAPGLPLKGDGFVAQYYSK